MLEVRDLKKRYGEAVAVDGVSFGVDAGEAVALVERLAGGTVVVCTHGDVASALLEACRTGPATGPPLHMGKAEVRLLRRRSGVWTAEGPFSLSGEVAPPVA